MGDGNSSFLAHIDSQLLLYSCSLWPASRNCRPLAPEGQTADTSYSKSSYRLSHRYRRHQPHPSPRRNPSSSKQNIHPHQIIHKTSNSYHGPLVFVSPIAYVSTCYASRNGNHERQRRVIDVRKTQREPGKLGKGHNVHDGISIIPEEKFVVQ